LEAISLPEVTVKMNIIAARQVWAAIGQVLAARESFSDRTHQKIYFIAYDSGY